jgi:hypothetical protein
MYTTLLMSTGLTFGTISSLFGLSHGIICQPQYSSLVAAVIGGAVVPTLVANAFYLPRHLLPRTGRKSCRSNRRHSLRTGRSDEVRPPMVRADAVRSICRHGNHLRQKLDLRTSSSRWPISSWSAKFFPPFCR